MSGQRDGGRPTSRLPTERRRLSLGRKERSYFSFVECEVYSAEFKRLEMDSFPGSRPGRTLARRHHELETTAALKSGQQVVGCTARFKHVVVVHHDPTAQRSRELYVNRPSNSLRLTVRNAL